MRSTQHSKTIGAVNSDNFTYSFLGPNGPLNVYMNLYALQRKFTSVLISFAVIFFLSSQNSHAQLPALAPVCYNFSSKYRVEVKPTILDILGSLHSTCTFVGARRLKELTKRTTFIRVQEQHNQIFDSK